MLHAPSTTIGLADTSLPAAAVPGAAAAAPSATRAPLPPPSQRRPHPLTAPPAPCAAPAPSAAAAAAAGCSCCCCSFPPSQRRQRRVQLLRRLQHAPVDRRIALRRLLEPAGEAVDDGAPEDPAAAVGWVFCAELGDWLAGCLCELLDCWVGWPVGLVVGCLSGLLVGLVVGWLGFGWKRGDQPPSGVAWLIVW